MVWILPSRLLRQQSWVYSVLIGLGFFQNAQSREEFFDGDIRLLKPWFTGPLLAPAANAVPPGITVIQPYVYWLHRYGIYDGNGHLQKKPNFNSLVSQLGFATSVGRKADIQIVPTLFYNSSENRHSTRFGDLPVGVDIQLFNPSVSSPWPSVKLGLREIFPTGSFDDLSPGLLGTDISGTGSYTTIGGLVFRKLWFPQGPHYLSNILSIRGLFFSPTNVKGLSLYGGAPDTNGRIHPGASCQTVLSFEYSLTDNWALALDNMFVFSGKDHFKGDPGTGADGAPAIVGYPASKSFSFAPAVEYNFRRGFGVIAGCWFTVWGRNSRAFASAVVSLVYAF